MGARIKSLEVRKTKSALKKKKRHTLKKKKWIPYSCGLTSLANCVCKDDLPTLNSSLTEKWKDPASTATH